MIELAIKTHSPFRTLQCAAILHWHTNSRLSCFGWIRSKHATLVDHFDVEKENGTRPKIRQTTRTPPLALLPLYYFEHCFAVDLQAQFFGSDGQVPTVHPSQFFSLEFTEEFAPRSMLAIPATIGVNRLSDVPWPHSCGALSECRLRRLSEISRHVLLVGCQRCDRARRASEGGCCSRLKSRNIA
ncbi:hypothetical protein SAMN05216525_125122 [Bradyrhizobium sp. Gha]|nr:hypothetical protein SAMN05216525_125122 [Bradyrhizobium sp. Gha]